MSEQRSFIRLAKRSFAFWFGGIWLLYGAPFLVLGIYIGIDALPQQERVNSDGTGDRSPFPVPKIVVCPRLHRSPVAPVAVVGSPWAAAQSSSASARCAK